MDVCAIESRAGREEGVDEERVGGSRGSYAPKRPKARVPRLSFDAPAETRGRRATALGVEQCVDIHSQPSIPRTIESNMSNDGPAPMPADKQAYDKAKKELLEALTRKRAVDKQLVKHFIQLAWYLHQLIRVTIASNRSADIQSRI